jgi:hypothetical protein
MPCGLYHTAGEHPLLPPPFFRKKNGGGKKKDI